MIRTIALGDYISVQGLYVSRLPDGHIAVRVGERVFTGPPVSLAPAPVPAPTANAAGA
ncbi:MAG: hypothetical protein IT545_12090 [Rhodobacteraceae bacterium]|nr:hypothetical protein [Paracoccaceae bacterium]